MPRKVSDEQWGRYFAARDDGQSVAASARAAHISVETAYRFERTGTGSGVAAAQRLGLTRAAGQVVAPKLDPKAQRALTDFAYFRKRYLGRRTVGWQTQAADQVVAAIDTGATADLEQRLVINAPPGTGKSTTFTHDIPLWLLVRDRTIRIMLGSEASGIATSYARRLRATLSRRTPLKATGRDLKLGLAFDADASLITDFGEFRPGNDQIWRAGEFTVIQPDGDTDEKEATVTAYGRDSEFLGGRFDVVIWDDVVTVANMRTERSKLDLFEWWDTLAETRVEPGGVFILQGQRIAAGDLYRYCIDKKEIDGSPTYQHIKYRAHDEAKCIGTHFSTASWPDSCVLDHRRLPYSKLAAIKERDGRLYEVVYQQGDVNPDTTLVDRVWIEGGEDDVGRVWPGNIGGLIGAVPEACKDGTSWSVMTVDPSPTKWWGICWMVFHPTTQTRHLVRAERRKMPQNSLLDLDLATGEFTGIADQWRREALEIGVPLDLMFVERNAAQRFMLQSTIWTEWTSRYGVPIVPHETHMNKTDPQYGLSSLVGPLKAGLYRFPDKGPPHDLGVVERLFHELTHYPAVEDSDLLMALWFFEHHLAKTWTPRQAQYQVNAPTYLREVQRGIGSGSPAAKPRLRFRVR